MITDLEEFIKFFHGQRRRTQWVVDAVPETKAEWRPWPGEPSPIEIVRRIAAGHLMYATAVAKDLWVIEEYDVPGSTWLEAVTYFQEKTEQALDLLRPLSNAVLQQKRRRPDNNPPTAAWRFLIAMAEHEIHHRTQLYMYLMLMNVRQPDMGGLTLETVRSSLGLDNAPQGSSSPLLLRKDTP
jgi:uncharacterized damage-inducible protein DinB